MLSKIVALNNLKEWGFNVPHYLVFDNATTQEDIVQLAQGEHLGIRTSLAGSFSLPFLYDLLPAQAYIEAVKLSQHYGVIVTRVVPPELTLYSCSVFLEHRDSPCSGTVEWIEGPSLGRDLERKADIQRYDFTYPSQIPKPAIRDAVMDLMDIPDLAGHDVIVEFTILKEPAGIKDEDVVLWEYRR